MKRRILVPTLLVVGALMIAVALIFTVLPKNEKDAGPMMTIACISDPHHEYFVQDNADFVRESSKTAVDKIKEITDGGADIVLVGGDITGRRGEWDYNKIDSVMNASFNLFSSASKDGKILLVTGNHDPEPTEHTKIYDINSNDYAALIKKAMGKPDEALYSEDINAETGPFNEMLCYKYTVNDYVFLSLNTPYGERKEIGQTGHNGLYAEQIDWLKRQLESIKKDKTVFVLCHYTPDTIYEVSAYNTEVDKNAENKSQAGMKKLLSDYENVIYLCGHIHTGETETAYESSEQICRINGDSGAMITHMGSLAYYDDAYKSDIGETDASVVQVTMIYVYNDKITFQVVNTGKNPALNGIYELDPYTVYIEK